MIQYTIGGGSVGCLYDYGPDTCTTLDDAIDSLAQMYELTEAEQATLRADGKLYFATEPGTALDDSMADESRRAEAGADYCEWSEAEYADAACALAAHLEVSPEEVEVSSYDDTSFTCNGKEYRVLTESERETAADEALDSYIDDCLEIPEPIKPYFDRTAWKRDALLSDGYGHTLSGYDGEENEQTIEGVDYYIYRTN